MEKLSELPSIASFSLLVLSVCDRGAESFPGRFPCPINLRFICGADFFVVNHAKP